MKRYLLLFGAFFIIACSPKQDTQVAFSSTQIDSASISQEITPIDTPIVPVLIPSDGFDYPVGPPNAKAYYNANPFGTNFHLGDDWNGVGGGNTDLGDPVYVISHGLVVHAADEGGGWGNVIRIKHNIGTKQLPQMIESLYAHLDTILVQRGDTVSRGDKIGTIGTAHGAYYAHLHLEIRAKVALPLGGGYSNNTNGYLNPTDFIKKHRPKHYKSTTP